MKLKLEHKLEILEMNLDSVNYKQDESFIIVDDRTHEMWLRHLESEERYEDCQKLLDKKDKMVDPNSYLDW